MRFYIILAILTVAIVGMLAWLVLGKPALTCSPSTGDNCVRGYPINGKRG